MKFIGSILLTLLASSVSLAQLSASPFTKYSAQNDNFVDKAENDTTIFFSNKPDYSWLTLGTNYEVVNSSVGLIISNGLDEQQIIHFEDLTANILFKLSGQTNFNTNYAYGLNLALNYPFGHVYLLSLNFEEKNFPANNLSFKNLSASSNIGLNLFNLGAKLELGYQELNRSNNLGLEMGLENRHRNIYYGAMAGYYSDYFTYSAYLQCFIYKYVSTRISYERIKDYDFLDVGIQISFHI